MRDKMEENEIFVGVVGVDGVDGVLFTVRCVTQLH